MVVWWPYNLIDNTIFNAAGVKVGCAKPNQTNQKQTNKQKPEQTRSTSGGPLWPNKSCSN